MSRREQLAIGELTIPLVDSPMKGSYITVNLTPASVATAVSAYQNVTVAGLVPGMAILPVSDPIANSVALTGARCTTANTLALQFTNPTAGALTPTAGAYTFLVIRAA